MKLESYWRFKGILLMFSYILVVSTGYILLISICPMLKARKMKSIASSAIFANLFKNYFRVQKYGGFLLNCTKISLTVLCWSSQQSTLWVDFKVESVLQSRRKKIKFYNEKKWEQLQLSLNNSNPKRDKTITRMKHKFIQGNEKLSYWMWFISFDPEVVLLWR